MWCVMFVWYTYTCMVYSVCCHGMCVWSVNSACWCACVPYVCMCMGWPQTHLCAQQLAPWSPAPEASRRLPCTPTLVGSACEVRAERPPTNWARLSQPPLAMGVLPKVPPALSLKGLSVALRHLFPGTGCLLLTSGQGLGRCVAVLQ